MPSNFPIHAPEGTEPIGYAKLIVEHELATLPPRRLTFLSSKGTKRERIEDGKVVLIVPPAYAPGSGLSDHIEFALKHEGLNLEVLAALFQTRPRKKLEAELLALVRARPTGQYVRKIWFLYELLTGRRLDLADVETGNYVELLDPKTYVVGPANRVRRQRIVDNLLGNAAFCPTVRKTSILSRFENQHLDEEATRIVNDYDSDAIRRAISYLYTKETRSSFRIEGETPSPLKTERFVRLLRDAPRLELSKRALVQLQNQTVDKRFADPDYREEQNYVGEQIDLMRQRIHFIPPKPTDVPSLMEGLLRCAERLRRSDLDPVIQAAVVSFGFVFIHPFTDGNGRLHRLLIHHILARSGFTPEGMIFPISAVMLQERTAYDECLEQFSDPLLSLLEYEEESDGKITVSGDTANHYRYFDATPMAESLYRWVEKTIRHELKDELDFVVQYRAARRDLESIVELPDRIANLFIKLCLQDGGRLSATKRKQFFSNLKESELLRMEAAVRKCFPRLARLKRKDPE